MFVELIASAAVICVVAALVEALPMPKPKDHPHVFDPEQSLKLHDASDDAVVGLMCIYPGCSVWQKTAVGRMRL